MISFRSIFLSFFMLYFSVPKERKNRVKIPQEIPYISEFGIRQQIAAPGNREIYLGTRACHHYDIKSDDQILGKSPSCAGRKIFFIRTRAVSEIQNFGPHLLQKKFLELPRRPNSTKFCRAVASSLKFHCSRQNPMTRPRSLSKPIFIRKNRNSTLT